MRTRVKICGVRDAETAVVAADAGADAVGLVFAAGSPRRVTPDEGLSVMYALPPMVASVAVVVDLTVDAFCDLEQSCPCSLWQLHGDESVETAKACGPGVIKALAFEGDGFVETLRAWDGVDEVSALLVDGPRAGSGEAIDWAALRDALDDARVRTPVILAGGLTPDNVCEAIRAVRPWGVDVSSGVERERGVKDEQLIRAFCGEVLAADASS
jgi:phosphoribosylanthranilate isomerase